MQILKNLHLNTNKNKRKNCENRKGGAKKKKKKKKNGKKLSTPHNKLILKAL